MCSLCTAELLELRQANACAVKQNALCQWGELTNLAKDLHVLAMLRGELSEVGGTLVAPCMDCTLSCCV